MGFLLQQDGSKPAFFRTSLVAHPSHFFVAYFLVVHEIFVGFFRKETEVSQKPLTIK